jgi:hypothetical protein
MVTNDALETFLVYFNLLNLFTYSHYILGEKTWSKKQVAPM